MDVLLVHSTLEKGFCLLVFSGVNQHVILFIHTSDKSADIDLNCDIGSELANLHGFSLTIDTNVISGLLQVEGCHDLGLDLAEAVVLADLKPYGHATALLGDEDSHRYISVAISTN